MSQSAQPSDPEHAKLSDPVPGTPTPPQDTANPGTPADPSKAEWNVGHVWEHLKSQKLSLSLAALLAAVFSVVSAMGTAFVMLKNTDDSRKLFEAKVESMIQDKFNAATKQQEISKAADQQSQQIMTQAFQCYHEMNSDNCTGQFDASLAAYDSLLRSYRIKSVPESIRYSLYQELLFALIGGQRYTRIRRYDIDQMGEFIDKWPRNRLCSSVYYNLGICSLATRNCAKARQYFLTTRELPQPAFDACNFSRYDPAKPLLLTILLDPANGSPEQRLALAKHEVASSGIFPITGWQAASIVIFLRELDANFAKAFDTFIADKEVLDLNQKFISASPYHLAPFPLKPPDINPPSEPEVK